MLPNIVWSRTDYISRAYATKMVAISSPEFDNLTVILFNMSGIKSICYSAIINVIFFSNVHRIFCIKFEEYKLRLESSHWREAIQMPTVWKGLLSKRTSKSPHDNSNWKEQCGRSFTTAINFCGL